MLLLHRTLPAPLLAAAMDAAVTMGSFDPDLVAVEARRLSPPRTAPPVPMPATAPDAALQARPAPSLGAYDRLLGVGA